MNRNPLIYETNINEQDAGIVLNHELVNFFLEKIDTSKFLKRVIDFYKEASEENKLKILYKILSYTDNQPKDKLLLETFKKLDIPNEILNLEEKKLLVDLYLKEKHKLYFNEINKFISSINKFLQSINISKPVTDNKHKSIIKFLTKNIENSYYITNRTKEIENSELEKNVNLLRIKMNELLNIYTKKYEKQLNIKQKDEEQLENKESLQNIKILNRLEDESEKTKAYYKQIEEFKKKQEKDLLLRIKKRKDGLIVEENNKKFIKNEQIMIEAYLEDFDSIRSRSVIAALNGNNINIPFYNGLIRLIDEDDSSNEIYFTNNESDLFFYCKNYVDVIVIDTFSNKKLNDILTSQTNNKNLIDTILNCLSIFHYINTFQDEKDKIFVSYEKLDSIKINNKNMKNDLNKSIVYLNHKQTIKTIKIKKVKRQIDGTYLIRGHWRRQRYLDGIKLIWIEPFWKGFGNEKQRIYKILKQT